MHNKINKIVVDVKRFQYALVAFNCELRASASNSDLHYFSGRKFKNFPFPKGTIVEFNVLALLGIPPIGATINPINTVI